MVLLTLPDEILEKICFYLTEIDVRRLSRTCFHMRKWVDSLYRPARKRLIIDEKHSIHMYAHLLSRFRWESVDDQLGVFAPQRNQRLLEINGQQNEICNRDSNSDLGCRGRGIC